MNKHLGFGDSLIVTLVGIMIVFLGLLILIGLIKVLVRVTENMGKKKEAPKAAAPAPVVVSAPVQAEEENDDALIAVITAAVACMMEDGSAFTVRHVRRISNGPAWNKAGREEQIYSRF